MNSDIRLDRILQNLKVESSFNEQYFAPTTLAERMSALNTPGLSLAIIDEFELVHVGAFGEGDTREQNKVSEDTLFLAGSISKSVFATSVLLLAQQGKLDLDEDINRYLSSWKVPANNGWQPRVTLRNILSHSAGFTVHGFPGYLSTEATPTIVQVLNGEHPANTAKVEVNQLPGLQYRYSGGGTTVAQLTVCEHMKETSFAELMHRLVLAPLDMNNSTFENPLPSSRVTEASVAYPSKGVPLQGRYPVYPEMAAAGLWTTPEDLAMFGIDLLKGLQGSNDQLLLQSTLEEMLKPQLPHQTDSTDYAGLGFFCHRKDDAICFEHGGWDEGFVCSMRLHHPSGKGAVVMINSNEGHPLIDEIFQAIEEEYQWPLQRKYKPIIDVTDSDQYVGVYRTKSGLSASIKPMENGLILNIDSQAPVPFQAISETSFTSNAVNTSLEFSKDDDSRIIQMNVKLDNLHIEMKKVE